MCDHVGLNLTKMFQNKARKSTEKRWGNTATLPHDTGFGHNCLCIAWLPPYCYETIRSCC